MVDQNPFDLSKYSLICHSYIRSYTTESRHFVCSQFYVAGRIFFILKCYYYMSKSRKEKISEKKNMEGWVKMGDP